MAKKVIGSIAITALAAGTFYAAHAQDAGEADKAKLDRAYSHT